MAQAPVVAVVGLRALNRDIKRATDDAGPIYALMKQAGRTAADPVAEQTRSTVPKVSSDLEGTIRVSPLRSGAVVRMGTNSVVYAAMVDFGGWPHGRQFLANGRYLYPAAEQLASTVALLYTHAIDAGFADFNWTNETASAGAVHD